MRAGKWVVPFFGLVLAGCGLRVPEIQEIGGRVEGQRLVEAILINITCELRDAVVDLREAYPEGTFLDGWGIQTTLTLATDEKGAIAPGAVWTPPSPPSSIFSLGAGLNFSSDATRTNKINAYYLISDLRNARCSPAARPNGGFLLQSDLKLSEWLTDVVAASQQNLVNFKATTLAVKENAIQHEVQFIVVTSGTLNPTWTLANAAVNVGGTFLSLGRTRTHDLLITIGPAVPAVVALEAKHGRARTAVAHQPNPQAADLHLSSQIAISIESAVRSGLQR